MDRTALPGDDEELVAFNSSFCHHAKQDADPIVALQCQCQEKDGKISYLPVAGSASVLEEQCCATHGQDKSDVGVHSVFPERGEQTPFLIPGKLDEIIILFHFLDCNIVKCVKKIIFRN